MLPAHASACEYVCSYTVTKIVPLLSAQWPHSAPAFVLVLFLNTIPGDLHTWRHGKIQQFCGTFENGKPHHLRHRLCSPLVIMLERRSCNHCAVCQWARLYCFIFSRDMPEGLSQRHMPEGLSQRQDATGYICPRVCPNS